MNNHVIILVAGCIEEGVKVVWQDHEAWAHIIGI